MVAQLLRKRHYGAELSYNHGNHGPMYTLAGTASRDYYSRRRPRLKNFVDGCEWRQIRSGGDTGLSSRHGETRKPLNTGKNPGRIEGRNEQKDIQ
jgi:hypothetical protein